MAGYIQIVCQSVVLLHELFPPMKEGRSPHEKKGDLWLRLLLLRQDAKDPEDPPGTDAPHKMLDKIEQIENEIDLLLALLDEDPGIPPLADQPHKAPNEP